jgi:hypothetical protein
MFDLGAEKAKAAREDEGIVVQINDERGEPMTYGEGLAVTVKVVGTYSKRYRDAERMRVDKRWKSRGVDPDVIRREALELTAECVLEWAGFFDGGKPLDCSRANVVRVLDAVPWVRQQIEVAMEDHAGFSRAPSVS